MTSVLSRARLAGMIIALLALGHVGCGPSSPADGPQAEARLDDVRKIQELSKKGYDFSEIRSIMKGEQPKARPKQKWANTRRLASSR
jgi:hypothetical protein